MQDVERGIAGGRT